MKRNASVCGRPLLLALLFALAATFCGSCGEIAATEVLVVVNSDLRAGTDLSALTFETQTEGASGARPAEVRVPLGSDSLPLSLSIVSDGGRAATFRLVVTGLRGEREVIRHHAYARFTPRRTVELRVFLSAACVDELCEVERAAGQDVTCDDASGMCEPVVLAEDLPEVDPSTAPDELRAPALAGEGGVDLAAGLTDGGMADRGMVDGGTADRSMVDGGTADRGVDLADGLADGGTAGGGMDGAVMREGSQDGGGQDGGGQDGASPLECNRGSERCDACPDGYEQGADGGCLDIDECTGVDPCDPEAFCANLDGSYTCSCPAYYTEQQGGRQCGDTRLRWLHTAPYYGVQALPFDSDLFLAGTIAGSLSLDGRVVHGVGGWDLFFAALDSDRKVVWLRSFGVKGNDRSHWIELDSQGNLLVTGDTEGGLDLGSGTIEAAEAPTRFIAKFAASDGSPIWSHSLPNTEIPNEYWEGFISADGDDNVLFCGRFFGTTRLESEALTASGGSDMLVAKLSPDGALLWMRAWGGEGDERCRVVRADSSGDILVAGIFDQAITFGTTTLTAESPMDIFLAKLDSSGEPIWARRMGGSGDAQLARMDVDGEGNAILAGYFMGTASFGQEAFVSRSWDAWIAKWSAEGTPRWSRQIGGVEDDLIFGVAVGPEDQIAVAGYYFDVVDFGEGPRRSSGLRDAFIAKYEPDGDVTWVRDFGAEGMDTAAGMRFDEGGAIYSTGWYTAPTDLGRGATSSSGMFVMELGP
ncbi:MAG: hypothetical protein OXU20_25600 [Myxococcales bacterium]|nr:hypothetical protein [Myxococcales bacterium]